MNRKFAMMAVFVGMSLTSVSEANVANDCINTTTKIQNFERKANVSEAEKADFANWYENDFYKKMEGFSKQELSRPDFRALMMTLSASKTSSAEFGYWLAKDSIEKNPDIAADIFNKNPSLQNFMTSSLEFTGSKFVLESIKLPEKLNSSQQTIQLNPK